MALTGEDEKALVNQLEAAGWRSRDFNGTVAWTLRGFDGVHTLIEAHGLVCQGWSSQRLAALVAPWYKDWTFWATIASFAGGLGAVVANELAGSQNHTLSALGLFIGSAAPFVSKYVNERAKQDAAADIRPALDTRLPAPPTPPSPPM